MNAALPVQHEERQTHFHVDGVVRPVPHEVPLLVDVVLQAVRRTVHKVLSAHVHAVRVGLQTHSRVVGVVRPAQLRVPLGL